MNPGNIAALAAGAGFSGNDLDVAVAIAMAESGGNPNKYNPETDATGGTPQGKGSYGLWQIYLRDHPEFEGWNLLDPQTNAHAAFDVYSRAGSFMPWSTYKYKQYLAFLPAPFSNAGFVSTNPAPLPPPLTIDANTGQPVDDATIAAASMVATEGLSFGKVLLWGALVLGALWLFEEAT